MVGKNPVAPEPIPTPQTTPQPPQPTPIPKPLPASPIPPPGSEKIDYEAAKKFAETKTPIVRSFRKVDEHIEKVLYPKLKDDQRFNFKEADAWAARRADLLRFREVDGRSLTSEEQTELRSLAIKLNRFAREGDKALGTGEQNKNTSATPPASRPIPTPKPASGQTGEIGLNEFLDKSKKEADIATAREKYTDKYHEWYSAMSNAGVTEKEKLSPEAYKKTTGESAFNKESKEETAEMALLDEYEGKKSLENLRKFEEERGPRGPLTDYEESLKEMGVARDEYALARKRVLEEARKGSRLWRIKNKLIGNSINIPKLPRDNEFHYIRGEYYGRKENWYKARLAEAQLYGFGGTEEEKNVQFFGVYKEFVMDERDKMLALGENMDPPREKGVLTKIWQTYARQNKYVKSAIGATVFGAAIGSGAAALVGIPALSGYLLALAWAGKFGTGVASISSAAAASQALGGWLNKLNNRVFEKDTGETKAYGVSDIEAGNVRDFADLWQLDKNYEDDFRRKEIRENITSVAKVVAGAATGIAVGGGVSAAREAIFNYLGEGVSLPTEAKTKAVVAPPPTQDSPPIQDAPPAFKILAPETMETPPQRPALVPPSPEKSSGPSVIEAYDSSIKKGGNTWESLRDGIIKKNPGKFGYDPIKNPDLNKWAEQQTSRIFRDHPDLLKNNLVHEGDKISATIEKNADGSYKGVKLGFKWERGEGSGIRPSELPVSGRGDFMPPISVEVPPRVDISSFGPEAAKVMQAAINNSSIEDVDHLFGKTGLFGLGRESGVDSADWARIKNIPASKLLSDLSSSDPEIFRANGAIDSPRLRAAEFLKKMVEGDLGKRVSFKPVGNESFESALRGYHQLRLRELNKFTLKN